MVRNVKNEKRGNSKRKDEKEHVKLGQSKDDCVMKLEKRIKHLDAVVDQKERSDKSLVQCLLQM